MLPSDDEDLGLFSPPPSPGRSAPDQPEVSPTEPAPQSSGFSSSPAQHVGGGGTSSKVSVSPNKKADDWDSDIDDLLGDDSDDEVKRTFLISQIELDPIQQRCQHSDL